MHRRTFLLSNLIGAGFCIRTAVADPDDVKPTAKDRLEGFRYELATAESLTVKRQKFVTNLRGQIGLTYDFINLGAAPDDKGRIWRGRPHQYGEEKIEKFAIRLEHGVENRYNGMRMAYDINGKDRSVNLEDQNHQATLWKEVPTTEEWFKKFKRPYRYPYHLQAAEGEFKGYYLDFGEPERVIVPDVEGEPKDRSYVRRQAILVKEPSELSVLVKLELRSR